MNKPKNPKAVDWATLRKQLGLTQTEFWGKLGVTQSAGSRYEAGRDIPKPTAELARLTYIEGLDLANVTGEGVAVLRYLQAEEPAMLAAVRKSASAWRAGKGSRQQAA